MKALINADELANDVAGAEALLDRHQEHKVVINTPGQSFVVSLRPLFNAWDAPIRILGANGWWSWETGSANSDRKLYW